jgi:hypothetical protein
MSYPSESPQRPDHAGDLCVPETRRFGVGPKARVAAMRTADELRDRGIAAAAMFKPAMGGWIVRIYPGGIRRRS